MQKFAAKEIIEALEGVRKRNPKVVSYLIHSDDAEWLPDFALTLSRLEAGEKNVKDFIMNICADFCSEEDAGDPFDLREQYVKASRAYWKERCDRIALGGSVRDEEEKKYAEFRTKLTEEFINNVVSWINAQ